MNLFDDLRTREAAAPFERLARKALAGYGLDESKLEPVGVGERVVFRVHESGAAYALCIHPRGWDRSRIERPLLWQMALCRESSVRCPEPVLTRAGDLIQSLSTPGISGFRHVILLEWVEAAAIDIADWTPGHAHLAGALIGHLHAHAKVFALPPELSPLPLSADAFRETVNVTTLARSADEGDPTLLQEAVDRVCAALSATDRASTPSLIHANIIPEHVLFTEDDAVLIGFHRASCGYRAYDLATIHLAFRPVEHGDRLRRSLLDGYNAAGWPVPIDAEAIDPFILYRLLDTLLSLPEDAPPSRARRLIGHMRAVMESE